MNDEIKTDFENKPENVNKKITESFKSKSIKTTAFDKVTMIINFILTFMLIRSVFVSDFMFSWRTTVAYLGFFTLASFYIISRHKRFNLSALVTGLLAVVSSFAFSLHGNEELNTIIFLMIMFLSGVYCIELTGSNIHRSGSYYYFLDVLYCELVIPILKLITPYKSLAYSRRKKERELKKEGSKKAVAIILGVALAIPVLAVVIPLLVDSDAVFKSFFGSFSNVFVNFQARLTDWLDRLNEYIFMDILLLVPTAIFAPYIFSVMFSFRHGIAAEENRDTSSKYKKLRIAPTAFTAVFLGVICVVYIIYLLTQTAYFFGAFSGKLPGGIKMSVTEYARNGFFEMVKIAAVNLVLVAISVVFGKRENGKFNRAIKLLDLFLCAFTILLSIISISKILLYIRDFGLTEKRVYVFAADVILIGVFLSVILRLFKDKFPYMKVITILCCCVVTILGLAGVDNFIASYNTNAYLSGKHETVDIDLLYDFDEAGIPYLMQLRNSEKNSKEIEEKLFSYYFDNKQKFEENGKIKSYYKTDFFEGTDSLDDYKALKLISKNIDYFTKNEKKYRYLDNCMDLLNMYVDSKKAIKTISVYNGEESSSVERADGESKLRGEFSFWFNTLPIDSYKITVTFNDGTKQKFKTNSSEVTLTDDENGNLCIVE